MLEQFNSFYKSVHPKNLEEALAFFSVFGGVEWNKIDTTKPLLEEIKKVILPDYTYIRNDINEITSGAPLYHALLSGAALGDSRTSTAFKRANLANDVGLKALSELKEQNIISLESSKKPFVSWNDDYKIADKIHFNSPFLRFWFAFVSPLFKGIRDGDYKEIQTQFQNRETEFISSMFTQLSHEVLKESFKEDKIVDIGGYWDKDVELDIYAKTASGKIVVGLCKYTNQKLKKSELTKLKELSQKANIQADIFVLFAKNGFSSELKSLKGESLKLFSLKNFKNILKEDTK